MFPYIEFGTIIIQIKNKNCQRERKLTLESNILIWKQVVIYFLFFRFLIECIDFTPSNLFFLFVFFNEISFGIFISFYFISQNIIKSMMANFLSLNSSHSFFVFCFCFTSILLFTSLTTETTKIDDSDDDKKNER